MSCHFDLTWVHGLHGDSTNHEEVWLLHLLAHLDEGVDRLVSVHLLFEDKCVVDGLLVPSAEEEDVSGAQRHGAHVTDLVRHLDGEHQPLGIGGIKVEHLN